MRLKHTYKRLFAFSACAFESQQQIPGDIIRALVYVLFARTTIDNDGAVSKLGCDSNLESSTSWSLPTVSGIIDSLTHNAHQALSLSLAKYFA
jgi:hypothetical protein